MYCEHATLRVCFLANEKFATPLRKIYRAIFFALPRFCDPIFPMMCFSLVPPGPGSIRKTLTHAIFKVLGPNPPKWYSPQWADSNKLIDFVPWTSAGVEREKNEAPIFFHIFSNWLKKQCIFSYWLGLTIIFWVTNQMARIKNLFIFF